LLARANAVTQTRLAHFVLSLFWWVTFGEHKWVRFGERRSPLPLGRRWQASQRRSIAWRRRTSRGWYRATRRGAITREPRSQSSTTSLSPRWSTHADGCTTTCLRRPPASSFMGTCLARTSFWASASPTPSSTGSTPSLAIRRTTSPSSHVACVVPSRSRAAWTACLEAYARAGGAEIERKHVRLHDLALAARWYRDAVSGESPHAPTQQLQFLRSLLRRASADAR